MIAPHRLLRCAATGALLSLLATVASAQIPISGDVFDGSGGPLLSGNVYLATSSLTVPLGQTLTVQPGAIVKVLSTTSSITIVGTLDANGSSGNTVIITSIHDDTAGGDTNGNGSATLPAPGNWRGLSFGTTSDASTLDWLDVRYGGQGSFPGLGLASADISLSNCTVRDCFANGIELSANSFPTVSNCAINNCQIAVNGVPIDAVDGFNNNTASGNTGNYMNVTSGTLVANMSIAPANILNGALVTTSSWAIGSGLTLTLQSGAIVKVNATTASITVNGTLDANGTPGNPVIITSFLDDTAGGDTNGDGNATAPAPGNWRVLSFGTTSDASTLDWLDVRYAGQGSFPGLGLASADISLSNCTVRDCFTNGIELNANSFPTVSNCAINNCQIAVNGVPIDAVDGFNNNTASGNTGNYMNVTSGTLVANMSIAPANILNGALVTSSSWSIGTGLTLTLERGAIVKVSATTASITVNGTLKATGTSANPVILTSFLDDTAGGDTNGDGNATVPAPGNWRVLSFGTTSDASTLDWLDMRYAGQGSFPGLGLASADISLSNCTVRDCFGNGIDLNSNSFPKVRDSKFLNNLGLAVNDVPLLAVPGFSYNVATGNGQPGIGGNYLDVVSTTVNATPPVTIEEHNVLGGALVLSSSVAIQSGSLTLGPGVVVKVGSSTSSVNCTTPGSSLSCLGTALHPVVFTSFHDDTVGGDTNFNGNATLPAPGNWRNVSLSGNPAGGGLLRHTLVRYAGQGNFNALDAEDWSLDSVRVERCFASGIRLSGSSTSTIRRRITAFANGGAGFVLADVATSLDRCTSVANTGFGFTATFASPIVSSIGWANTGGNFGGSSASSLSYSTGSSSQAGSNGNINLDPVFVNQAGGDLRLTAGSPCIDTGDPLGQKDPDCTVADMGAYFFEQALAAPTIYCTAKINSLGCLPFVDFVGFASTSDSEPFTITANDVLNQLNGLLAYGFASNSAPFSGGTLCVNPPLTRTAAQSAGGDELPRNCTGTYTFDMNALIQSGTDTNLVSGATVYAQYWGRDPEDPFTIMLSNGIRFTICP